MVTSVYHSTTFTITMATNEVRYGYNQCRLLLLFLCYYSVGPSQHKNGFGWGTGLYGGVVNGAATTTLATALTNTTRNYSCL